MRSAGARRGADREGGEAGVAVAVDGLDGDEVIVFREPFDRSLRHVADVEPAPPEGLVGGPPHDPVAGEVGLAALLPGQPGVIILAVGGEPEARRRGRGEHRFASRLALTRAICTTYSKSTRSVTSP